MSADYTALRSAWTGLTGTTVQKIDALNASTVGQVQDVPLTPIKQYLMNKGRIAGLAAFITNTPSTPLGQSVLACNYLYALLYGEDGDTLKAASDPGLLTILQRVTDDARTGFVAADITALNNAVTVKVPWWQANGFSVPVTLSDLVAAGNLF